MNNPSNQPEPNKKPARNESEAGADTSIVSKSDSPNSTHPSSIPPAHPQPVAGDDELFTDNFYMWLEANGVKIGDYIPSSDTFTMQVDMNVLKPAIMQLMQAHTDAAIQEAVALATVKNQIAALRNWASIAKDEIPDRLAAKELELARLQPPTAGEGESV